MGKSAAVGIGGALVGFLLGSVAPQPRGSIVLWSLLSLLTLRMSYLLLRRTTMYTAVIGALCLGIGCVVTVVSYANGVEPLDRLPIALTVGILFVGGLTLSLGITPRVYKEQWKRWREHIRRVKPGVLDMLFMSHGPDLRHT